MLSDYRHHDDIVIYDIYVRAWVFLFRFWWPSSLQVNTHPHTKILCIYSSFQHNIFATWASTLDFFLPLVFLFYYFFTAPLPSRHWLCCTLIYSQPNVPKALIFWRLFSSTVVVFSLLPIDRKPVETNIIAFFGFAWKSLPKIPAVLYVCVACFSHFVYSRYLQKGNPVTTLWSTTRLHHWPSMHLTHKVMVAFVGHNMY